jgi:hypothetical protein
MVIWSDYLASVADFMGTTTTQAGVLLSLIVMIALGLAILIATKGRKAEFTIPVAMLLSAVLFTYIGWLPVWTGSVLSLVLAIFVGKVVSGGF